MAEEDTPLDQEVFDATLEAELGQGHRPPGRRGSRALGRRPRLPRRQPGGGRPSTPAAGAPRRPPPRRPPRPLRPPLPRRRRARRRRACGAPSPWPRRPVTDARARGAAADRQRPRRRRRAPTDKHRLLALVPPEGIQRVEREQGDRVNVWPHLLIEEFVAMLILLAGMTIFSTFINAPLRELANPNLTPNPSKAPWYFLGLQELLRYFHPMVAGITIPTFILVGLAAVPYVDRNPSTKPGDRKIAITMFTILFMFGATLTIIGSFFRGPGYNWIWPWAQGVFFEL